MLEGYPKRIVLKDGTGAVLRPMVKADLQKLREFFADVPEGDRRCLRDDVGNPEVIQEWAERLDYERVLPILAEVDGQVIADATLHRRKHGLTRHLGKVRIVVGAEYRRKGLGTWMLLEIVNLATELGLDKLVSEFVVDLENPAIRAAEGLGFHRMALIPNYFRDADGKEYDMATMVRPLYPDWGDY